MALAVSVWCLGAGLASAQGLRDNFADREVLIDDAGRLDGDNTAATLEPGEPRHGGKTGGHSMWISWIAPTNGVVRFKTQGSDFDTLLSAYYLPTTNDTNLGQLVELSRADDSEGLEDDSEVKFGVQVGLRYEIAVDGYFGASGQLRLDWDFEPTRWAPPVILSSPGDQSVNLGDPVTLTVVLTNEANGDYRWYRNGVGLPVFEPILQIPAVEEGDVGRYQLRVSIDGPDYYSVPAEIQINSDGAATALARDKILDAINSSLHPEDGGGGGGGGFFGFQLAGAGTVTRGYNGTQIFNTTYATPDPREPAHCGLNGGATFWYAYKPPADGTLTLDTIGSGFDTFLAVYTYDPPLSGYGGLISIACDNDSAGTNGAARLELAAPKTRQFLVVVDGIDGARGLARLNYRLDTNRPPAPPTLIEAPISQAVAVGASVVLQPVIAGSGPLHYLWRKGTDVLAGLTNATLAFTNVAPSHSGEYIATVSSHVGSALDVRMPLRVLVPPQLQFVPQLAGPPILCFSNVVGQRYVLERTESLELPWQPLTNSYASELPITFITNSTDTVTGFFRLRVE